MEDSIDAFIRFLAVERGLSENYQLSTDRSLSEFAQWCSVKKKITHPRSVTLPVMSEYLAERKRATRAEQKGEAYELTPEQCAELQQEGIQYYHRYLSLFQINDFEGVVRDTQRNLDLFSFVNEHTDREDFSWGLQQFRPYVLMMNTRGKASIFLAQGKFADAMAEIERGREAIVDFLQQSNFPELASKSAEVAFLDEWLEEVKSKRPLSKLEIMQREMETAITKELYERAAELRDAIKLLKTQRQA